jgi:hypothetical protein
MQQMRLTRCFMGLLAVGLSMMPIAARADVAALLADLDGAQPNRGRSVVGTASRARRGLPAVPVGDLGLTLFRYMQAGAFLY